MNMRFMARLRASVALVAVALFYLPQNVLADPINLGGPSNQSISFTGDGGNQITVTIPAQLSGPASFGSDSGIYTFGPPEEVFSAIPVEGSPVTSQYAFLAPVSNSTDSFTFLGSDGDELKATANWHLLASNAPDSVKFYGALTVLSASGDSAFLGSNFNEIDFFVGNMTGSPFPLSQGLGSSDSGVILSGEIGQFVTPEPGSLLLMTFGLVFFGAARWWMRRKESGW